MNYRSICWLLLLLASAEPLAAQMHTENVILITLDGLRWQELFTGADSVLMADERYTDVPADYVERYWADDAVNRRARLMPFFWNTIAEEGQLYGNRELGCRVDASNRHLFSYPGYNEILTGRADDERIDSNEKRPNPNVTVLEAVNRAPGFNGRVAAFGSWDVFPFIINERRSGVPVNAGFEPAVGPKLSEKERLLNTLQEQVPSPWSTVRLDAFTHHFALEHLRQERPRLLYVAYGETDDFAHDGDFDAYLTAAERTDAFIAELWNWAQAQDDYRGSTTFVITTDHGRGEGDAWTGHGSNVDGAEAIWLAVLGPDTPALGERTGPCDLYQNQVAATVARFLDVELGPEAGAPVASAFGD